MGIRLRELEPEEYGLLKTFLYEAIYVPEGAEPPDRSIVDLPELEVYYKDFGSGEADCAIAADYDGSIIGLAWSRIMDDYGHIADDTPSVAIAILKEFRGGGIGTQLMLELIGKLRDRGYRQVSLSVQKENYAVRLYKKTGFRIVGENPEEYIMVCDLTCLT